MFNLVNVSIAFAALVIIILLFSLFNKKAVRIKKERVSFNIKGCRVIYSDTRPEKKDQNIEYSTLLKSDKYDIQGKPDFIFENKFKKLLVPVEIKSGLIKDDSLPHKGDLMQLAAYFAIVEEEYGRKIRFGKIMYKDYMFTVYNTPFLRKELIRTLDSMRLMLDGERYETQSEFIKCRHCLCKMTVCEFYEK